MNRLESVSRFTCLKVVRQQSGSSLIQIVISIGIMGVLMASFITMTTQQNREMKALREDLASMDLQKMLMAVLADGVVCKYALNNPSPQTFNSTSVSAKKPAVIKLNKLLASGSASAPIVAEVGQKASSYSNSLIVSAIKLNITGGTGNTYVGDWIVEFDSSKTVRQVRPVTVSTMLTVDKSTPSVTKITACQKSGGTDVGSESKDDEAGGGYSKLDAFMSPGSFQWTAPTGVKRVTVEVWGGGGSGSIQQYENPIVAGGSSSFSNLVSASGGRGQNGSGQKCSHGTGGSGTKGQIRLQGASGSQAGGGSAARGGTGSANASGEPGRSPGGGAGFKGGSYVGGPGIGVSYTGCAGGGGGYAMSILEVTPGKTYSITVGDGGGNGAPGAVVVSY